MNEKAVKHTGADAVGTPLMQIVNGSDEGTKQYPCTRNELIYRKQPIVCNAAKGKQLTEMARYCLPFSLIKYDARLGKISQKIDET